MRLLPLDRTADAEATPIFDGLRAFADAAQGVAGGALRFDPHKSEELTLHTVGEVRVVADALGTTALEAWMDYACNHVYLRIRAPDAQRVEALAALAHAHFNVLDRRRVLRAARRKRRHPRDLVRLALVAEGDIDGEVFTLLVDALASRDLAAHRGALHAMALLGWPGFVPALEAATGTVDASLRTAHGDALVACRR